MSTPGSGDAGSGAPGGTGAGGGDTAGVTPAAPNPVARVVMISAAVLAVLLLGAAGGMLIGLPQLRDQSAPSAESVDVGFAQDMSVHHLQAVQMAGWAREHTADPVVRQIAYDIESTQQEQVGRMKGWLALWNQPEVPYGGYMAWMTDAGSGHSGHGAPSTGASSTGASSAGADRRSPTMPGMASQQELTSLRSLSGKDLDVFFLQLMLRHHKGGESMLRYAAERAGQPVVRNLAASMLSTQSKETETLQSLLTERGGQPLPPN
ncbi:DUF305 domain-containing protein [Streptoalloteichus hindustanus]|uniref:Uncharacterized conserved protein, DUF305 family n=1 Tax=Streptoalloteichus hindustanus TaxID=2017 RepID=A0A1M5G8Y5_STRHI|nr:DUF305 domain-containing protein [Streptoalloteichus hindustanus]SHG00217.1 Uncharacterized conserved protein, DUF305 family [Streptoalloteichus hindustanus]